MHNHQNDSDSSDDSMERLIKFTCDAHNLRIVLLGVSGAGKSSVGNAILGRKAFEESRTRESKIQRGSVEDRNISIIDTPGFFNDHLTEEELQKQMMKSLDLSDPGPHMFLLIINLEKFEKDERNIVAEIEKIFGAQALKFTMVLFIGRERMSEWNDFTLGEKFKGLVKNCREQYHEINSTNVINQTQKKELIIKIDELFKHNEYYNNKIYSVSQTSSINEKQERQKEVSQETFEINTAMEGAATHEYVSQTKKPTDEEANLQGENTLDGALPIPSQGKQKQDKSGEMSRKNQQTTEEHPTQAGGIRCWVLTTVLICVLLVVVIIIYRNYIIKLEEQISNKIKVQKELEEQIFTKNIFMFGWFILAAVQMWINPFPPVCGILSIIRLVVPWV